MSRIAWCSLLLLGPTAAVGQVQESVEQVRSGDSNVTVECFAPAFEGKYPAIVMLHGSGGLEQATGPTFRDIARGLASRGYAVLIPHVFERNGHVPGQRLRGEDLEAYAETVHDTIDFAATSPLVAPDSFGVIGLSMGASLAFRRAAKDPRIKAVVCFSGSLPLGAKAKFPPILLLHGSKDSSTPVRILRQFERELKDRDIPVQTYIYSGMRHNFDVEHLLDAGRRAGDFFDVQFRARPQAPRKAPKRSRVPASKPAPKKPDAEAPPAAKKPA
jgi:dienelactone hydrolase